MLDPRIDGDGEDVSSAHPKHAACLSQRGAEVRNVLERLRREDQVERRISVRQPLDVLLRVLRVGETGRGSEERVHPADGVELRDLERMEALVPNELRDRHRLAATVVLEQNVGHEPYTLAGAALATEEALPICEADGCDAESEVTW